MVVLRTADQQKNADDDIAQSAPFRQSVVILTPDLKASLATLTSVNADGLTNTQEHWWCSGSWSSTPQFLTPDSSFSLH